MEHRTNADEAMRAGRRVQAALWAMADEDSVGALREVNSATLGEARWMIGHLLGQMNTMAALLAARSSSGTTRARIMRAAAHGLDEDVVEVGVAVIVDEAMRREGRA